MPGRTRPDDERGSSLVGTSIAVLVFVAFLATAVHLLTAMYATSTVMAVSTDAARAVAARNVTDRDLAATRRRAEADAREALGGVGRKVHFEWTVTETTVRLRVVLDQPWRLGPNWNPMQAFGHLDRTVVLHRERPR